MALEAADITPVDVLARAYNGLISDKRYLIHSEIPKRKFSLITMFNILDHMDDPAELLRHVAAYL